MLPILDKNGRVVKSGFQKWEGCRLTLPFLGGLMVGPPKIRSFMKNY
jgi:hypothetical protein